MGQRAAALPAALVFSAQAGCSAALLIRGRRGFLVIRFQASDDVSRAVPWHDLGKIGLETAFELLFLLGTAPFRHLGGPPDLSHVHRRAVGFELQLVLFAISVDRAAGDAGNLSGREASELLAYPGR